MNYIGIHIKYVKDLYADNDERNQRPKEMERHLIHGLECSA